MKSQICVLEMGGTISAQANTPTSEFYVSPSLSIDSLLLPPDDVEIIFKTVTRKISHELTVNDVLNLADILTNILCSKVDGIVVTMGTNAIEDIAYFIGLIVNTEKPIVFTGANFPQGSLCFDGQLNLYNAICLAASKEAQRLGVLLTFNGYVTSAKEASKSTPGLLDNFNQHSIHLGEIIGGRFKLKSIPNYKHTYASEFFYKREIETTKISILYAHLGMEPFLIEAMIKQNVQGIISAGFGKGYQNKLIAEALSKACDKGIIVVRCPRASSCYTSLDSEYDNKYGFLTSHGLSPHKSSILLMVALAHGKKRDDLMRIFEEY